MNFAMVERWRTRCFSTLCKKYTICGLIDVNTCFFENISCFLGAGIVPGHNVVSRRIRELFSSGRFKVFLKYFRGSG